METTAKVERVCQHCGKKFVTWRCQVKRGGGLYCSDSCRLRPHKTVAERFWAKVDRSSANGCWTWKAATHQWGYGRMSVGSRTVEAHCIAWELAHGPIPEGQEVLHSCDNPACVRVDHLFLGTNDENRKDSVKKKRHAFGVRTGHAKLSDKLVSELRKRYAERKTTSRIFFRELADELQRAPQTIADAVYRRSWKHVA